MYISLKAEAVELSTETSSAPSHEEEMKLNATKITQLLEGAREDLHLDV